MGSEIMKTDPKLDALMLCAQKAIAEMLSRDLRSMAISCGIHSPVEVQQRCASFGLTHDVWIFTALVYKPSQSEQN